jgi:hypothetical protein
MRRSCVHPPVEHFVGTTAEGTTVTFDRTIERQPHVTHFNFGTLSDNCGSGVLVTTGREIVPPYDEFALPIRNGGFSGTYYGGDFVHITGQFGGSEVVTGTVHWADADQCQTNTVSWTAQPAGWKRAAGAAGSSFGCLA